MPSRDCPFCGGPLDPDVGAGDNGAVKAVMSCSVCGRDLADPGEPFTLAEVRERIRKVTPYAGPPLISGQCTGKPGCLGGVQRPCTVSTCECRFCGHPGRAT